MENLVVKRLTLEDKYIPETNNSYLAGYSDPYLIPISNAELYICFAVSSNIKLVMLGVGNFYNDNKLEVKLKNNKIVNLGEVHEMRFTEEITFTFLDVYGTLFELIIDEIYTNKDTSKAKTLNMRIYSTLKTTKKKQLIFDELLFGTFDYRMLKANMNKMIRRYEREFKIKNNTGE